MGPGAVMGELGFLESGHARTATCVSHTDGLVAAIPYQRIMKLHETSRDLYIKFMLLVAESGVAKLQATGKRMGAKIVDLEAKLKQLESAKNSAPPPIAANDAGRKGDDEANEDSSEGSEADEEAAARGREKNEPSDRTSHKSGKRRGSVEAKKQKKKKRVQRELQFGSLLPDESGNG